MSGQAPPAAAPLWAGNYVVVNPTMGFGGGVYLDQPAGLSTTGGEIDGFSSGNQVIGEAGTALVGHAVYYYNLSSPTGYVKNDPATYSPVYDLGSSFPLTAPYDPWDDINP